MDTLQEIGRKIGSFFQNYGYNILAAILIFIIAYFLIKLLCKLILRIIYATKIDNAVGGFFVSVLSVILWIITIFSIVSVLGISGNSFLVAFSSVALAIGMALKDSLANIANGIIIIITKPFKKGDHIMVDDVEGIVKSIKILTTEIFTFDNKKIVIPNSKIVTNSLINFTANPTRRITLAVDVSYNSDTKKVKKVVLETVAKNANVLSIPAPVIFLKEFKDSSVSFELRVWVKTQNYLVTIGELNEAIFEAFNQNDIEIPFNQIDVNFRTNLLVGKENEKNN